MIDLVRNHGYPVWHKFIETWDGYILDIYRIPGPRHESLTEALAKANTVREPVLMLHGITSSSETFVMNGPEYSPAYILADTGDYDVWLWNVRGNCYSRHH